MSPRPPIFEDDLETALAQAERDFRALHGARLLLTGATGFFGAWLLESLGHARARLGLDVRAVALTRDPEGFLRRMPHLAGLGWLAFARGDVRSFAPPDGGFTHVVHAATSTTLPPGAVEDPLDTASVIVDGARRVLELARERGASRLLFTSSGAVYGRQPPSVSHVPEDYAGAPDPLDVRQAYGTAKRLAELLCAAWWRAGGPEPVVARGFAFVGPHLPLDAHFAVGNFLRDGLAGRPIRVLSDGTPRRSYLHGADLAAWLWAMLARGAAGRAYNLGSDEDVSLGELAARVGAALGVASEVLGKPAPDAVRNLYVPSVERARRELGLEVTVPLDEAIRRTARWHRGA